MPGPPDPAWSCGKAPDGKTICVDPAPDMPDTAATWSCKYTHSPIEQRVCRRAERGPIVGGPCGDGCPDGMTCKNDRCALDAPRPNCWIDSDCPSGTCRYGSCK